MHAIRTNVTRLLWLGLGAGAVLAAGCTGGHMAHTMMAPVTLTGSQEVPPVSTTASGISDISVGESKCPSAGSSSNCPTVTGVVSTKGIIGTAAHIHRGAPGQTGPVVISLVKIDGKPTVIVFVLASSESGCSVERPAGRAVRRPIANSFTAGPSKSALSAAAPGVLPASIDRDVAAICPSR